LGGITQAPPAGERGRKKSEKGKSNSQGEFTYAIGLWGRILQGWWPGGYTRVKKKFREGWEETRAVWSLFRGGEKRNKSKHLYAEGIKNFKQRKEAPGQWKGKHTPGLNAERT